MNTTIIQQARNGTVKPLLASRIKSIISREELKVLAEIEFRAVTLWKEKEEFALGQRRIREARENLTQEPTAENRVKVDEVEAKYRTAEYCSQEEDLRYSQLAHIERESPQTVYPVLRRVLSVLDDIKVEMANAERKAFEQVGFTYDQAGPVLLLVIEEIYRLGQRVAAIKGRLNICAQFPSDVLESYLDLTSLKPDSLSARLSVPDEEPEPLVVPTPREQAFRDNLEKENHIDRATGKPIKPELPGVEFRQYGGLRPGEISSDGEFSKELGRVAQLPPRI